MQGPATQAESPLPEMIGSTSGLSFSDSGVTRRVDSTSESGTIGAVHMAEPRQNVLVVEVDSERYEIVAPLLQRKHFDVDRFPGARGAVELVAAVPFRALIVGYPLKEMSFDDFFRVVRGQSSASSRTPIALLCDPRHEQEAKQYLQRRIQLVMSINEPQPTLEDRLSTFLGIQARASMRVLVKLNVTLTDHRQERFMAQTKDISTSGMFVSTNRTYPQGSQATFEFALDTFPKPFAGVAEIVRVSGPADKNQGLGLRFLKLLQGSRSDLESALETR